MEKTKHEPLVILLGLGSLLYFCSLVWVNLHGAQWFNFDMYADATFASLAAGEGTLFPESWLFGNQYYFVATPALAVPLYMLFSDRVVAISVASILMMVLILAAFVWCGKALFDKRALLAGLFCMAGATVLGDSVSSCTFGFQILYSMASYYACYLLVILLHLGIWVRLLKNERVSGWIVFVALLLNLCVGAQSLRETLTLNVPLLVMTVIAFLRRRESPQRRSLRFAAGSAVLNLVGVGINAWITRSGVVHQAVNIEPVSLSLNPGDFASNLRDSIEAFGDLVGLRYLSYSWKWRPIALLGAVLLAVTIAALVLALRSGKPGATSGTEENANVGTAICLEDRGPVVKSILLFCWLSLLCVLAAGVFVMRVRAIYFFVWLILVPLSAASLTQNLKGRAQKAFVCLVLLCGAANYVFNFYPDFSRYGAQRAYYSEIVSWLTERGVDTIYGDYQAPTIAASSGESISYTSVFPNLSAVTEEDGVLIPWGSPVDLTGYRTVDPKRAVLVLCDSPYDESSGYRYLTQNAPEEYQALFEQMFREEACFPSEYITCHIYSFETEGIFPASDSP